MPRNPSANDDELKEPASPAYVVPTDLSPGNDIDHSLLADSLSKTPWERMLANDDALNFAESLRAAMEKRHAKLK